MECRRSLLCCHPNWRSSNVRIRACVLESPDSSCGAAIMTRSIKGFKVDWGDRWRHSAWAERETAPKHMYWFEVSPDRTVKLLHRSSRRSASPCRGKCDLGFRERARWHQP